MALSGEHRSKFAALNLQWWRFQMIEWKILEWDEKLQKNKQTNCWKFVMKVTKYGLHRETPPKIIFCTLTQTRTPYWV